jgi:hypothetical protein
MQLRGYVATALEHGKGVLHVLSQLDGLREAMVAGFNSKPRAADTSQTELVGQLYQQIGQLTVERDWLKKKSTTFGFGS